jgi:hypothetical protein
MRIALWMGLCLLAGCASDRLASTAPAGVDLSGSWKLNEAESDDAQRLMQSQLAAATQNAAANGQSGSNRRSRNAVAPQGPMGPVMPSVAILDEGLRWPGRNLTIKQAAGVVTFSADGTVRDCNTRETKNTRAPEHSRGRGDAPPPKSGWDDKALVVESGEQDEGHPPYDQRFTLSSEGDRLVEVVTFRGGASSGFTASRVWDRSPASAPADSGSAGTQK